MDGNSQGMLRLVGIRVKLFRAGDWVHFIFLPFLSVNWNSTWLIDVGVGMLLSTLCLAFAYSWNNVHDAGMDSDKSKNPLSKITEEWILHRAWNYSIIPGLLAVAVSAFLGWYRFSLVLASIAISAVYSAGPRLKAVPIVGTIVNVGIFIPLAFIGRPMPGIDPESLILVGAFALMLLQNQVLHEAADFKDDLKNGIKTSAVLFGDIFMRIVSTGLGAGASLMLFSAGFVKEWGNVVSWEVLPLVAVTASLPLSRLDDPRMAGLQRWFQKIAGLISGFAVWVTVVFLPHVMPS